MTTTERTIEKGRRQSAGQLSILMYHQVGRFAPMRAHRANYCDHRRFARQMALLRAGAFQVLSLEQALRCLAGVSPIPVRALVLTFDDAYANFLDYAAPVLADYGYPATVYAISDWLGQPMRWRDPQPDRATPRLMSGAELRSLHQAGISLGSHSCTHARLAELSPEAQRAELTDSRARLQDILGEPVLDLCYPFGSFNTATLRLAAHAGYRSATTCLRGAATAADHPLLLPRKAISYGDNLLGYSWKLLVKHAPKPALQAWRARRNELPSVVENSAA
ncbi:polysaccharide deacetylase family protein [Rhabdochromatium marinum]|uniref:polysaccharide deacetylase family protein n=1 Tax=Rhabdochromatium marinum TaxID=48729 RepID=UPI00190860BE|nr:polysaccharide deacetylase family protein [Rhabdochromatium marinum]MBK1648818.1 polysaccharide deacetylase [Rhabdochromatium marinum]